jgi:Rnl2 family RNA ligase
MSFLKYSSIENHYQHLYILNVCKNIPKDEVWVVTEKVHGSNFSIIFDDKGNMSYGRRNSQLEPDEIFMNHQEIMKPYIPKFKKAYEMIKTKYNNTPSRVILYGELYGHMPEIFYSKNPGFYGFDIYVNDEFLVFDEMTNIYKTCDIFHAEELFRGTFSEAFNYKVEDRNSTIPAKLNQEEYAPNKNIWEGVVFRPINNYRANQHTVIKKKSSKFMEKTKVVRVIKPKMDNVSIDYFSKLLSFNTQSRIAGMFSKEGKCKNLVALVMDDIMIDYLKEYPAVVLTEQQERIITTQLSKDVGRLYGEYLKTLI